MRGSDSQPSGGRSGVGATLGGHKVTVLRQSRSFAETPHPGPVVQGGVRFLLHHVAWLPESRGTEGDERGGGGRGG
jgi:hypothetical protein